MARQAFVPGSPFDGQPKFSRNRGSRPAALHERLLEVASQPAVPAEGQNAVRFEWGVPVRSANDFDAALHANRERVETGVQPVSPGGLRMMAQIRAERAQADAEASAAASARADTIARYEARGGDPDDLRTLDEILEDVRHEDAAIADLMGGAA